jgi:hypothetical protein
MAKFLVEKILIESIIIVKGDGANHILDGTFCKNLLEKYLETGKILLN